MLLSKLVQLNLPSIVINWICSFLAGRGQQCKVNGKLSLVVSIGRSILQRSGIGPSPTLYIFVAVVQVRLKCRWSRLKRRWTCTSHINLVGFYPVLLQLMRSTVHRCRHRSALGLIHLRPLDGSTFVLQYYSLGGDIAVSGGLYARLCTHF